MISEASTHPRVLRLMQRPVLFMSSLFPLGRYFEALGPARGQLGAGGSVATTAWDLARFLGCDPIVMAGLDLGFPGMATHFKGAFFETRFHQTSGRLAPSETLATSYLLSGDPYPVPANDGGLVLTDRRMAIYAAWFESQMKIHPGATTRTLTAAGVKVPGISLTGAADLLMLPRRRELIDDLRTRGLPGRRDASLPDLDRALRRLDGELEGLEGLAREAVQLATAAGSLSQEAMIRLSEIDAQVRAVSARDIVGFLMQALISRISEAPAGDPLASTRELYLQVSRAAALHRRLAAEAMEELARAPLEQNPQG